MAFSAFTATNLITEGLLNDLALAEQFVAISLTDTTDLFNSPIIYYVGDVAGVGSNVLRHRLIGLGFNLSMDATAAETTDVAASSVSGTYADVTIARRAIRLDESQLAQITGGDYGFDPLALGSSLTDSFRKGRMASLGSTVAGASTNITSASTGSVDDLMDVIDQFSVNGYTGNLFGMLHPTAASSIRDDLRSEAGPLAYRGDVQAYRALGAEELLGIAIFPTGNVISAASKYENAILAEGAIAYGIGSTTRVITNVGSIRPAGLPLVIDLEVDASAASLEIVGNGYDGMAIREQGRIVGLVTATS